MNRLRSYRDMRASIKRNLASCSDCPFRWFPRSRADDARLLATFIRSDTRRIDWCCPTCRRPCIGNASTTATSRKRAHDFFDSGAKYSRSCAVVQGARRGSRFREFRHPSRSASLKSWHWMSDQIWIMRNVDRFAT